MDFFVNTPNTVNYRASYGIYVKYIRETFNGTANPLTFDDWLSTHVLAHSQPDNPSPPPSSINTSQQLISHSLSTLPFVNKLNRRELNGAKHKLTFWFAVSKKFLTNWNRHRHMALGQKLKYYVGKGWRSENYHTV